MPNQFIVPQFIDVEDKILGPVSVRQFIVVLAGAGLIAGAYQILAKLAGLFPVFLFTAVGILILTIVFAFMRVNGRPFHLFMLNVLQSLKNPRMRIWNNQDFTERLQYRKEPPPPAPIPTKHPMTQTKLARLSLIVDTGGAYHDDDDLLFWGQSLNDKQKHLPKDLVTP